jgi:radical SAM superfamily enzyme YgiQ (UPF0313 family)
MKILLIAPASGQWRQVGKRRWINGRTFRFSMLSLLSVAAQSPSDATVRIVDEQIEGIPWDEPFDLVGITVMTALAPRAYELAHRFRASGTPVVLGGFHPSLCPDEALRHADAVVVGDAEGLWTQVVTEVLAHRSQGIYRHASPVDLRNLPPLPRHLLQRGDYATVHAVQATRGCTHGCSFCSVSAVHRQRQRQRPIPEVLAEIAEIPSRFFLFVDDNLMDDREYARELLVGLTGLRKQWVAQSTLGLAREPDLVRLAAEAGCVGVFVGMETFTESNLASVGKSSHRVAEYRQAIEILHRHGIGIEAGLMFGFEGDNPAVFARTLTMLEDLEIDAVQVSLFTPLPGTPFFSAHESDILDWHWAHYDFHHVVWHPRGMSVEALQAGHDWITREFYRPWRIARRVWRSLLRPCRWRVLPFLTALNLAYLGRVWTWHIQGWNPAREQAPRESWLRAWWRQFKPAPKSSAL